MSTKDQFPETDSLPRHFKLGIRQWERLETENEEAFHFFRTYRDLPSPIRTMKSTSELLGVTVHRLAKLNKEYSWERRAQAYDDYLERIRRDEVEDLYRLNVVDWEQEKQAQRHAELKLGKALQAKAMQMLQVPLLRNNWKATDAAKFAETGGKLVRLATGMETDRKTIDLTERILAIAAQVGVDPQEALRLAEQIGLNPTKE